MRRGIRILFSLKLSLLNTRVDFDMGGTDSHISDDCIGDDHISVDHISDDHMMMIIPTAMIISTSVFACSLPRGGDHASHH